MFSEGRNFRRILTQPSGSMEITAKTFISRERQSPPLFFCDVLQTYCMQGDTNVGRFVIQYNECQRINIGIYSTPGVEIYETTNFV